MEAPAACQIRARGGKPGRCRRQVRVHRSLNEAESEVRVRVRCNPDFEPIGATSSEQDALVGLQLLAAGPDDLLGEPDVKPPAAIEMSDLSLSHPNGWTRRERTLARSGVFDLRATLHERPMHLRRMTRPGAGARPAKLSVRELARVGMADVHADIARLGPEDRVGLADSIGERPGGSE